eukprot:TRINITY_DN5261_c0_g1_i1.p1 TRINITY_DN5261_c0_g1~~TRINITY_DN5261_c0_g1_i1.p1  ORF type:complete len:174 (+),score=13.31 TRINITY_DN5261_c0_g1_i1:37-558(+)
MFCCFGDRSDDTKNRAQHAKSKQIREVLGRVQEAFPNNNVEVGLLTHKSGKESDNENLTLIGSYSSQNFDCTETFGNSNEQMVHLMKTVSVFASSLSLPTSMPEIHINGSDHLFSCITLKSAEERHYLAIWVEIARWSEVSEENFYELPENLSPDYQGLRDIAEKVASVLQSD